MHQQKAGYQVVIRKRLRQVGLSVDGQPHHPLECCAVEFGYLADQLLGPLVRRAAARSTAIEKRLYSLTRRAPPCTIVGISVRAR
jgi:hypothetical protein